MTRDPLTFGYPDPPLGDDAVLLRPWASADLDCVREATTDPRIRVGTTVPAEFSPESGAAFITRQQRRILDGDGVSLAVVDAVSAVACGLLFLAARPQPGVVGLGYWLVPSARGRGLARRSVGLVTDWLIASAGIQRVEAWVEPDNLPSQQLLMAAGFVREGELRSFLTLDGRRADVIVFSRISRD